MRIVVATLVGLLLATAYPATAEPINSPPVDLKPALAPPKLALAERAAHRIPLARSGQPGRDGVRHVSARDDAIKQRLNSGTIGLAAGQLEGAPLRFATELARVLDDGDKMRVVPMVTRGISDNIYDLLYLRGVDAAIVYGDMLESFSKDPQIAGLKQRINYIMPLFPSEVHVFVRPEIKRLEDLAGKAVNFNTKGTAAAYSGPIIFDRLGIKVDAKFDPHPVALAEMANSDKYAAVVFVSSKPLDAFVKRKWPEGYKFLPMALTRTLEEYYLPAQLDAADYPGLIPAGQKVETIAVPSVLAVFNWPQDHERGKRLARFVDYLFDRFPKLQTEPGYHPKWSELNLAASVPGWQRFAPMQAKLGKLVGVPENADRAPRKTTDKTAEKTADKTVVLGEQLERLLPGDKIGQARLLRELLDRRKPTVSQ
jgi:TRAP-type uncharacterized transport system substrate-binding protein